MHSYRGTFISKGWGSQVSDKDITKNSAFLNNILPGDLVLDDRGFNVDDSLGAHGATYKYQRSPKVKISSQLLM